MVCPKLVSTMEKDKVGKWGGVCAGDGELEVDQGRLNEKPPLSKDPKGVQGGSHADAGG